MADISYSAAAEGAARDVLQLQPAAETVYCGSARAPDRIQPKRGGRWLLM